MGFDPYCLTTDNALDKMQTDPDQILCGLQTGWHIATAGSAATAPLNSNNPGGDWSNLYNIAISGTKPPGSAYLPGGNIITWMKNNGFSSQTANAYYWTAQSVDPQTTWVVNNIDSTSVKTMNSSLSFGGIFLVHEPESQ